MVPSSKNGLFSEQLAPELDPGQLDHLFQLLEKDVAHKVKEEAKHAANQDKAEQLRAAVAKLEAARQKGADDAEVTRQPRQQQRVQLCCSQVSIAPALAWL